MSSSSVGLVLRWAAYAETFVTRIPLSVPLRDLPAIASNTRQSAAVPSSSSPWMAALTQSVGPSSAPRATRIGSSTSARSSVPCAVTSGRTSTLPTFIATPPTGLPRSRWRRRRLPRLHVPDDRAETADRDGVHPLARLRGGQGRVSHHAASRHRLGARHAIRQAPCHLPIASAVAVV